MSNAASKPDHAQTPDPDLFVEKEHSETKLTYDHGTMPWFVAAIWFVFLIAFVAYLIQYGLADFNKWPR